VSEQSQVQRRPRGRPSAGTESGRDRLLAAGLELFSRSGFAATTVEDLVAAAGVTAPALYHHFGTKAGLYVAVAEQVYQAVLDRHEEMLAGASSFAEAIDGLMELAVVMRREQPLLSPMFLSVVIDTQRNPELRAQLQPTLRTLRRFFDRFAALAPAELRATPRAERSLARALVTLLNGLSISASLSPSLDDYTDTVASLHGLLERGSQS
jgi:AcrR family transcriptional regulator